MSVEPIIEAISFTPGNETIKQTNIDYYRNLEPCRYEAFYINADGEKEYVKILHTQAHLLLRRDLGK